jgi:hypothetical protein
MMEASVEEGWEFQPPEFLESVIKLEDSTVGGSGETNHMPQRPPIVGRPEAANESNCSELNSVLQPPLDIPESVVKPETGDSCSEMRPVLQQPMDFPESVVKPEASAVKSGNKNDNMTRQPMDDLEPVVKHETSFDDSSYEDNTDLMPQEPAGDCESFNQTETFADDNYDDVDADGEEQMIHQPEHFLEPFVQMEVTEEDDQNQSVAFQ